MMLKYRHAFQATAVLGCMLWGGYQITSDVFAQPLDDQLMTVVENSEDLAVRYPDLAPEIARAISSVVATQQVLDASTGQGVVASGVIINDYQILTAGHNVEADKGLSCSQTSVLTGGLVSSATASRDAVTHASVRYGDNQDMAILNVDSSLNFQSLPDAKLANRQPKKGEIVYFVNFQPTADGNVRSPAIPASSNAQTDYSKPAIFTGTVLGSDDNGLAIATGHGKSFAAGAADTMLRKGASGGAILNAKGELVGLSVSSKSLAMDNTAKTIAKKYGLQLPEAQYQVAFMQPITKTLVKQLQSSTVSCGAQR